MMEKTWLPHTLRTEDAILRMAKSIEADVWAESAMSAEESEIWSGINLDFSGVYLLEQIGLLHTNARNCNTRKRQRLFYYSLDRLRIGLRFAEICAFAWQEEPKHFTQLFDFDSDSKAHFKADAGVSTWRIHEDCWAERVVAENILLTGQSFIESSSQPRTVLIRDADLETFMMHLPTDQPFASDSNVVPASANQNLSKGHGAADLAQTIAWLRLTYPSGPPEPFPYSAALARLKESKIKSSKTTLNRAVAAMRVSSK